MTSSVVSSFARPPAGWAAAPRARSLLEPEEGWLSILLLLALVGSTVWSVDQARWVEGTGVLFPIALAGMGAGFLFARSRLAGWIAFLLGLVAGLGLTFAVVGQLLPPPGEMPGRV